MDAEGDEQLLAVRMSAALAEYTTLRQEILQRMDSQRFAANFLLLVLGAASAATATLINANHEDLAGGLVSGIPLITGPLAFMFFDNELMIFNLGSRLHDVVSPRIVAVAAGTGWLETASEADGSHRLVNLSGNPLAEQPKETLAVHRWLSQGRFALFVLPTVLCTIWALGWSIYHRFYWGYPYWITLGVIPIVVLDVVATVSVLFGAREAYWQSSRFWTTAPRKREQRRRIGFGRLGNSRATRPPTT